MLMLFNLQVENATEAEKKRLEQEKNQVLESLQAKHRLELDRLKDDMAKKHRDKVNDTRNDLNDTHDKVSGKVTVICNNCNVKPDWPE